MTDNPDNDGGLNGHQPQFEVRFWGIHVSGRGISGIAAAVIIVGLFVAVYRF